MLIENIDNCLRAELSTTTSHALYELMSCVYHVVGIIDNPRGLVIVETRGAVDAFFMTLQSCDNDLTLKVLEVLNVILDGDGNEDPVMHEALREIIAATKHLAAVSQKKPLEFVVRAIEHGDLNVKLAVMTFLKTWMMQCVGDFHARIQIRLLLERAGLPAALVKATESVRKFVAERRDEQQQPSTRLSVPSRNVPKREKFRIYGICYVTADCNDDDSYLSDLRNGECTWVSVEGSFLQFWRNDEEEFTDMSLRPQDDPLVVVDLAAIKCLDQFSSNADIRNHSETVFRLELFDGSIINFGFFKGQEEQFENWRNELWYLCKKQEHCYLYGLKKNIKL